MEEASAKAGLSMQRSPAFADGRTERRGQEMLIPWASPAGARALYKPLKTDIIGKCTSVRSCKPGW